MKRILVNATFPNELRVAEIQHNYLCNLDVENYARARVQNNIYKGSVSKYDASLEAFFVNYGDAREGFLPLRNVPAGNTTNQDGTPSLKQGDEIIVQVAIDKNDQESKGAVLTAMVKLTGKYVVLSPTATGEVQIPHSAQTDERPAIQKLIQKLDAPKDINYALRSSALKASTDLVYQELHALIGKWREMQQKSEEQVAPIMLLREHNAAVRVLRDNLEQIAEVWIDTEQMYESVKKWVQEESPSNLEKIKHHDEKMPLFQFYDIEKQVNMAYDRCVALPAGGNVLIDHTAAMTTIDVNSSKGGATNMEETALKTNLEAVKEIARQLRVRDIGGQIVIDLIDMKQAENIKTVETKFREYMRHDTGNPKIADITDFCLLLMTRKRLRPSISDIFDKTCTNCGGTGRIRTHGSMAMTILREAQRLACTDSNKYISVVAPAPVCSILFNDYRDSILNLEKMYDTRVIVSTSDSIPQDQYDIKAGADEYTARIVRKSTHKKQGFAHHVLGKSQHGKPLSPTVKHHYKRNGVLRRLYNWLRLGDVSPIRNPQQKHAHRHKKHAQKNRSHQPRRHGNYNKRHHGNHRAHASNKQRGAEAK